DRFNHASGSQGSRYAVIVLLHQIHAALELADPIEKLLDHSSPDKWSTMLRHYHLRLQLANHVGPEAAGLVTRHVAPMEALHGGYMGGEVGHRLGIIDQGRAHVP